MKLDRAINSSSHGFKMKPQGVHERVNRSPLGLGFARKYFIQAFTIQTRLLRNACYTTILDHMPKGNNKHFRIGIFIGIAQILGYFLIAFQKINRVKGLGFHDSILACFRQCFGFFNIFALTGFIAAAKQKDNLQTVHTIVNAIPFTDKDTHFRHPIADRLHITKVSSRYASDTIGNRQHGLPIAQFSQPFIKCFGTGNVVLHRLTVAFKLQVGKVFDKAIRAWLKLRHRAIARYGVNSPLIKVRIVTLIGGFFYAHPFNSLYGGLFGDTSVCRFLGRGLLTPFNLPPVINSSDGRNIRLGASL